MPYSERSWSKLSKGRWEARSHGLSKDVELRPPTGGQDLSTESHVPRLAEEKKKSAPSYSSSEKKNKKKAGAQASVLHHETFLRYRDELNQLEAEVKLLIEKRDKYKLLSDQREGEAKGLRAELEAARKEQADLVEQVKLFEVSDDELDTMTNGWNLEVQQKIDRIDQLLAKMDAIKVKAEEWRGRMDCLASKKETAWAQLASAEAQIWAAEEKPEARSQNVEELQSQLSSAVSDRETLSKEFKVAKSVVEVTKVDTDEMVAQYKDNAEASQDRLKDTIEYVKLQFRREALKEVHTQGFDLSTEVESAKGFEVKAKKLASPEDKENSEGSNGSRGGEDSNGAGDEAGSGGDQAV
ncbi:uncharacterized protein [Nicotiana tomentosiformis]|uniref:uncharacterized protein n=1 Tax=Nicotiana tomentosiformis TaxID=4098 RepID=UPI00388CA79A